MFKKFFGKLSSARRNLRAAKKYAPKLWAGIAITTVTAAGVFGTNLAPATSQAAAVRQTDADAVVTCAYRTLLNREPDQAGRAYWTNQFRTSGNNISQLATRMSSSREGQYKAYVTPYDMFVRRTFYNCLGRTASTADRANWGDARISSALTRANIFAIIIAGNGKPLAFPSTCKNFAFTGDRLKPHCRANTAGNTADVSVTKLAGTNITVNSAWANNVKDVRAAAARAGFNLQAHQDAGAPAGAGSYRSPGIQAWLKQHGYPAAAPGRSMHEWGLAIDFDCNGRSLSANSACLNWMRANAPRYGLYELRGEAWHWSSNAR